MCFGVQVCGVRCVRGLVRLCKILGVGWEKGWGIVVGGHGELYPHRLQVGQERPAKRPSGRSSELECRGGGRGGLEWCLFTI